MHISIVDILLVAVLVGAFIRGYQIGFIQQIGSTIGFVVGLYPGSLLSSWVMLHVSGQAKPLSGLAVLITVSCVFMAITEVLSARIRLSIKNVIVQYIDTWLGSLISLATLLIGFWLAGALFQLAPPNILQAYAKDSRILGALNSSLPPATSVLSSLNKLIDPNQFPEVFAGREPSPSANFPVPQTSIFSAMLASVKPSVVKIEGLGCGGIVDGSGFVYSSERIVTNAHVIAGVKNPKITDANGTREAVVVLFDPHNDIAVLRLSRLAGKPLIIDTTDAKSGTSVFALGYPGGGQYDVQPGAIMDQFEAIGQDIYGEHRTVRSVYGIQATIVPGNSGGPVVDTFGHVRGVVFATSTTYNNVGYVITAKQAEAELHTAETAVAAQGTGQCSK